jgi:predicted  nucleic acid-binding Zn-ribbon protein
MIYVNKVGKEDIYMDISITKPYQSLENRDIEFDYTTIKFTGYEINDLFEQIDSEIHDETRDDLLREIEELKAERDELQKEIDDLDDDSI